MKILLVDDTALNREVIGKMLQISGHQVTPADGGEEAVDAVSSGDFDLVLMDVRMPGMDGFEATRRIRAMPGVRGLVPIVATSAQPFVEREIRAAGADGFIARVFTVDELIEAIADGVAAARERDPAAMRHSRAAGCPAAERRTSPVTDDPEPAPVQKFFIDRRAATAPAIPPKPPWMTPSKLAAGFIAACAVVALLWQPVAWLTGGLRPQSQIDLAELQKANAAILSRLEAVVQTQASDKAQQLTAVDNLRQLFSTRLDAMWRPSDLAERDAHLSRLDSVFEAQRDKITDAQYAIKDLQAKYQSLITAPTPGPARGR